MSRHISIDRPRLLSHTAEMSAPVIQRVEGQQAAFHQGLDHCSTDSEPVCNVNSLLNKPVDH
jgi:hypothetical protein